MGLNLHEKKRPHCFVYEREDKKLVKKKKRKGKARGARARARKLGAGRGKTIEKASAEVVVCADQNEQKSRNV